MTDTTDTLTQRPPKAEKVAIVADVRQRLESADAILFTEYRGLNVSQLAELRTALAPVGGTYKIYKNTLAKVAASELEMELDDFLLGPTGMAFVEGGDAAAVAKVLDNYRKEYEVFVIKGGLLGRAVISEAEIKRLATLPSREQLLSELGGLVQAPMAKLAGSFAAPLNEMAGLLAAMQQKLAGLVRALADKGGAAPAEAESAEAEPEAADASAEDAPAEAEPAEAVAAEGEAAAEADAAAEPDAVAAEGEAAAEADAPAEAEAVAAEGEAAADVPTEAETTEPEAEAASEPEPEPEAEPAPDEEAN